MRLMIFLMLVADHLLFGEWRWFSRVGFTSMWAGATMAARKEKI